MNILHITAASSDSGAGRAVVLTHKALLAFESVNSRILFLKKESLEDKNFIFYSSTSLFNKFKRLVTTSLDRLSLFFYRKKKPHLFSTGLFGINLAELEAFKWADIIHIHWANHGFIDIGELNKWDKPIIWTLRDMWAFTGGCHYSFECSNYTLNCGKCPALGSRSSNDMSRLGFQRKKKYLLPADIRWVAISSWMQIKAKQSFLLRNKNVEVIYSGINTNTFINIEKLEARAKLNIPNQCKVILIGAANLFDEYKGFKYIVDVLRKINTNILIISFGQSANLQSEIKHPVIDFGYVKDETDLAFIYNSADVFLAPSVSEAFGKTIAEAQSCGTPVVCFQETGPADIVEHLITGYLAKYKDEEDLLKGLLYCLNNSFNIEYIRNRSKSLFEINIIAKQYLNIYHSVLPTR